MPLKDTNLIEMALQAQLLANAANRAQFLGSYTTSTGATNYYIAEMVSNGCDGTWIRPSPSVIERAIAKRRYDAEYTIPK